MNPIWYDNTETGAPVVNDVAGSVISMLKAVFETGFNVKSISSISVSGEVAAVTCPGHGYSGTYGKWLKISGASVPSLNGVKQQTIVDANTFTFPAPGVADGSYTATDARRAPLGWTEEFSDGAGTKAIFKRSDPAATVSMLRVVDTKASPASPTYCISTMVEAATGIDAVTNEVPTVAAEQLWMRGANNSTAKKWVVCGSGRRVWVLLQPSGANANPVPYLFGDPQPLYPGDSGGCVLTAYGTTVATSAGGIAIVAPGSFAPSAGFPYLTFQRSRAGALDHKFRLSGGGGWGNGLYTAGSDAVVPVFGDVYVTNAAEVRARLPELFLPQSNVPFTDLQVYDVGARKLLAVSIAISNTGIGQMMLDLSSDWD